METRTSMSESEIRELLTRTARIEGMLESHITNYNITQARQEAVLQTHSRELHELSNFRSRIRGGFAVFCTAITAAIGAIGLYLRSLPPSP